MPRKKRAEKNPLVSVRQPAFIPTEYVARLNWDRQSGENLKAARLSANYSREYFAVEAGCSKQYIQNIEEASVATTGYLLISKMCELLGVSLLDILESRD